MYKQVVKKSWRNSENRKIGTVFACGATTSNAEIKRRTPLDSARQIGLGSTSHDFFNSSGDGWEGGELVGAEFFLLADFSAFRF